MGSYVILFPLGLSTSKASNVRMTYTTAIEQLMLCIGGDETKEEIMKASFALAWQASFRTLVPLPYDTVTTLHFQQVIYLKWNLFIMK